MEFAECGIREAAIDDQCSICLVGFCESNPSTAMNCKHEFHHKCILEWSGRSSVCPLCAQHLSPKDPASPGLLRRVEQNRGQEKFRLSPSRPGRGGVGASAMAPSKMWSSHLNPAENLKAVSSSPSPPLPKKQKTETGKTLTFESAEDVSLEALNMLPAFIASHIDAMNKYVGTREAERLMRKSDEKVFSSCVSHFMKAAILMVEHTHRMVEQNKESHKTMEELDAARAEIEDLHREKAKMRKELVDAQTEITVLQREREKHREDLASTRTEITVLCREKEKSWEELGSMQTELAELRREKENIREELGDAQNEIGTLIRSQTNTSRSANRAWQTNIKLKDELKKMRALEAEMEKLKSDIAIKETEAVKAVESFKNSEEFKIQQEEAYQTGARALYDAIKQEHPEWDLSCFVETDDEDEGEGIAAEEVCSS